jgi:hypothetical protein
MGISMVKQMQDVSRMAVILVKRPTLVAFFAEKAPLILVTLRSEIFRKRRCLSLFIGFVHMTNIPFRLSSLGPKRPVSTR